MHIVQIVIKNTSVLDYSIPLFFAARRQKMNLKISILYCVMNKNEILKHSAYYSRLCDELEIEQLDFFDFSPIKKLFPHANKAISARTEFPSLNEIKKLAQNNFICALRKLFSKSYNHLLGKLLFKSVELKSALHQLSPDVIFFDIRNGYEFPGQSLVYEYLYKKKLPVFLVPHAPHMRDETSEFTPFDSMGERLPAFCRYLIAFKHSKAWTGLEEQKSQFLTAGYPGLDSAWLEHCLAYSQKTGTATSKDKHIIFALRRYLPQGLARDPSTDDFILSYEEIDYTFQILNQIIKKMNFTGKVIIKPHPSNSLTELDVFLDKYHHIDFVISNDSIYHLLSNAKMMISVPSTVALITSFSNIPTLIIDGRLQKSIENRWSKLHELYSWCSFKVSKNNIEEAVIYATSHPSLEFRENFYDDNSSERLLLEISKTVTTD